MDENQPRQKTLLYAGMALLALLALAMTINALQLDPGQPLPLRELAPDVLDTSVEDDVGRSLLAFFRIVLIITWVLLPLYLILLVVSKSARKRLLRMLMAYLPIILVLYMLAGREGGPRIDPIEIGEFGLGEVEVYEGDQEAALPEYQPPAPWVTTLTTVLLAGVMTLAIGGVVYALYRRSRRPAPEPLRLIQQEAQAALDALEAGGDLREVILRSYQQMVHALREYRNIHRDQDMTPHEFQAYLERRGLPAQPVRQLTELFEQVRYGGLQPGRQEQRAAVASLNAIVAACQRNVRA